MKRARGLESRRQPTKPFGGRATGKKLGLKEKKRGHHRPPRNISYPRGLKGKCLPAPKERKQESGEEGLRAEAIEEETGET